MSHCGVVIPIYAQEESRLKYFDLCLRSLVRQTHPFVGLVVDDGSPMFSEVEQIVRDRGDERFHVVERARRETDRSTASNALNFGIDLLLDSPSQFTQGGGEITSVCYLHSDDMLRQTSLLRRVTALEKEKTVEFVYGKMLHIDEQNAITKQRCLEKYIPKIGHRFPHYTIMWKKDFLNELREYARSNFPEQEGVFDQHIAFGEDRDVSLSTLELGYARSSDCLYVSDPTYYYREHSDTVTGKIFVEDQKNDVRVVNSKHNIPPLDFLTWNLPWSLAYNAPEPLKNAIRPIRDLIKKQKPRHLNHIDPLLYEIS